MKAILEALVEGAATPLYAIADLALDAPPALLVVGASLGLLALSY